MKYIYTAAWVVIGGISLKGECRQIELINTDNAKLILTSEPDAILARVDEAAAVGRLLLQSRKSVDFRTMLVSEIESIKEVRKKKIGAHPVLIFQAQGEIDAMIKEPIREHETFIVAFDAVDKSSVRQLHQTDIEVMKVAVALDSDAPSRFAYLTDGTYLLNKAGKSVYSISFSMNAEAYISAPVSEETVQSIATCYVLSAKTSLTDFCARTSLTLGCSA